MGICLPRRKDSAAVLLALPPEDRKVYPVRDVDLLNGRWMPAEVCLAYANTKKGRTILPQLSHFFLVG